MKYDIARSILPNPGRQIKSWWSMPQRWLAEKTGPEEVKVVLSRSTLIRMRQILVHLVPIGITATVLYLALSETYWHDPFDPLNNTKLQGLQFAAKVYETFIVISLATTVLDVLRRRLLSGKGVQFGSLITAYGFDRISSLFSPAFWAAIWSSGASSTPSLLAFVLAIAVLLATAAGPSAAIALIPRLEWWSVPQIELFRDSTSFFGWESRYTINSPLSFLWPKTLSSDNLPETSCLLSQEEQSPTCPGAGYPLLWGLATSSHSANGQPDDLTSLNLTVPESVAAQTLFIRQLTSQRECFADDGDTSYGVVSSTPSFAVSAAPWNFLEINGWTLYRKWDRPLVQVEAFNGQPPVKPFVQVKCDWTHHTASSAIEFPSSGLVTPSMSIQKRQEINGFCSTLNGVPNRYTGQNWTVNQDTVIDAAALDSHTKNGTMYFRWVDLSHYHVRPSLAALVYSPSCDGAKAPLAMMCTIDARWVPTKVWVEPETMVQILGLPGGKREFYDAMVDNQVPDQPILIDMSWADSLNAPVSRNGTVTAVESILTKVFKRPGLGCGGFNYSLPLPTLEAYLGLIIVDGLARVGIASNYSARATSSANTDSFTFSAVGIYNSSHIGIDLIQPSDLPPESEAWVNVTFSFKRYGYGYGFTTLTSKVAMAVLLAHAVVGICSIVFLIFAARVSSSWDDTADLLVLALKSPAPETLHNTGAGVGSWKTWKERVGIRASSDEGTVNLLVGNDYTDGKFKDVELGRAYG